MDINGEIFDKTGPRTFPEEHHRREAAALVWKEIRAVQCSQLKHQLARALNPARAAAYLS